MAERTRFITIYGPVLIGFFAGCLYTIYIVSHIQGRPFCGYHLGNVISLWYLVTAAGLLTRKIWGYYLFKFFLYVLLLAFPIGTIVSYMSLAYMKKHEIKRLFFD